MRRVVLAFVLVAACRGSSPPAPAPVVARAPAEEPASDWYRSLVAAHGADRVVVGAVPYAPDQVWLSSRDDPALSSSEELELMDVLHASLDDLAATRLPDAPPLAAPTLYGLDGELREIALVFDPPYMARHVDVLVEALERIQAILARPAHRRFRIAVQEGALVVYPGAIFLGGDRFARAADLRDRLPAWLAGLRMTERNWD